MTRALSVIGAIVLALFIIAAGPINPPFLPTFGTGAPSNAPVNQLYFDTGAAPYVPYVYNRTGAGWQSYGGGGGSCMPTGQETEFLFADGETSCPGSGAITTFDHGLVAELNEINGLNFAGGSVTADTGVTIVVQSGQDGLGGSGGEVSLFAGSGGNGGNVDISGGSGGTGGAVTLSGRQIFLNGIDVSNASALTASLNVFTPSLSGAVPFSGGGSSNFLRADGSWATPSSGPISIDLFSPPTAASFTTFTGDATSPVLSDVSNLGMVLDSGALPAATVIRGATEATPGASYTVVARIRSAISATVGGGFLGMSLCLSDGTKFITFGEQARGPNNLMVFQYTNSTTFSTAPVQTADGYVPEYWKIKNDGTNRQFFISSDGRNWTQILSQATGTWLSETRVGFCISAPTSATSAHAFITVPYWSATTP